ncbi:hypothetical protein F511_45519 [Dorcoceras hygrometricum]|uniref:Uncharacterized protein n=1 Tax=Dorcoceras hygrometricum TaxID=472368 RepID=A0A2Z6ZVT6_9LAMI|nr:hypothetical protein F511_45519 [Dorcoceras hygrometricum]
MRRTRCGGRAAERRTQHGGGGRVGEPRRIRIVPPDEAAEEQNLAERRSIQFDNQQAMTFIGSLEDYLAGNSCLAPTSFSRKPALHGRWRYTTSIRSTTGYETSSSAYTRRPDEIGADGFSSKDWPEQFPANGGGD